VIELFGNPAQELRDEAGGSRMIYISPDFLSPGHQPGVFSGFEVFLKEGKVTRWSGVEGSGG
jgi:hypothetical protein